MKNKRQKIEDKADYPIGTEFEYEGTLVLAVADKENENHCEECFFSDKSCKDVACLNYERDDDTDVHFKEA